MRRGVCWTLPTWAWLNVPHAVVVGEEEEGEGSMIARARFCVCLCVWVGGEGRRTKETQLVECNTNLKTAFEGLFLAAA